MTRLIFSGFFLLVLACSGTSMTIPDPVPGPAPEPPAVGVLKADGNSEATYELIRKCGYNGVEAPDQSGCHTSVQHITQSKDNTLGTWVFDFWIHINEDNDRNIATITDRQRNEIKTDAKSPASLVGQRDETMRFRWKFRLPKGMKTTTQFCHLHQIKGIDNAVGTADVGNPVFTYTARSMSNGQQQFQVIYVGPTAAATGNVYLAKVDLADFLGEWVSVDEYITFGEQGSFQTTIMRVRDGKVLVEIPETPLNTWRDGTTGMRPKWGIYRSFGKDGALKPQLRDELLQFADFSIEKVSR